MQTVLLTPTFERQASAAGLGDDDIAAIVSALAADPLAGDLIPGTAGARKVRFARAGAGKSGGYRTIHYSAATTFRFSCSPWSISGSGRI